MTSKKPTYKKISPAAGSAATIGAIISETLDFYGNKINYDHRWDNKITFPRVCTDGGKRARKAIAAIKLHLTMGSGGEKE